MIITKSNKNIGWKKCIFAMTNLQIRQLRMRHNFPVSDYILTSSKNPCDIYLKYVLLAKLNLWQNPV